MRAGLPLSVGEASVGTRLLIASVFLLTAALCVAGGRLISETAEGRAVAVTFVVPLGLIGAIAAAFVLAPRSRFGDRLDRFVPRLREPLVASGTGTVLWLTAFLLTAGV